MQQSHATYLRALRKKNKNDTRMSLNQRTVATLMCSSTRMCPPCAVRDVCSGKEQFPLYCKMMPQAVGSNNVTVEYCSQKVFDALEYSFAMLVVSTRLSCWNDAARDFESVGIFVSLFFLRHETACALDRFSLSFLVHANCMT